MKGDRIRNLEERFVRQGDYLNVLVKLLQVYDGQGCNSRTKSSLPRGWPHCIARIWDTGGHCRHGDIYLRENWAKNI